MIKLLKDEVDFRDYNSLIPAAIRCDSLYFLNDARISSEQSSNSLSLMDSLLRPYIQRTEAVVVSGHIQNKNVCLSVKG